MDEEAKIISLKNWTRRTVTLELFWERLRWSSLWTSCHTCDHISKESLGDYRSTGGSTSNDSMMVKKKEDLSQQQV